MVDFIAFVLPWYVMGFISFALLWRWWLLLPIGAGGAILAKIEWDSLATADSPGLALGMAIYFFLVIGAASGATASLLVNIGRSLKWRWLKPLYVLPAVILVGFGSYFAFAWIEKQFRAARLAPPPQQCVDGLHLTTLGNVNLRLPIAPNIYIESTSMPKDHYLFASNQDARDFCDAADRGLPSIVSISLTLDGMPSRRPERTKHAFCARPQPNYAWAGMTCNLIDVSAIPDMPVRIRAALKKPGIDMVAISQAAISKLEPKENGDGVKIYAAEHSLYLARADGYVAKCYKPSSRRQPYLSCEAYVNLDGSLALSYRFRTTEGRFAQQSAVIDREAREIFQSLQ